MSKASMGLLVFILLVGTMGLVGAPSGGERPRNIILIGWDGAQRDHVKECLSRGELPNLKKLASEGALVGIDILRVTDTKAGWTQILTGYEPEVSGVFSNGRYGPIPKGYTLFERLEQFFGPDKFVTVAVIGKKGHVDAEPPQRIRVLPGEQQPKPKNQQAPVGVKQQAKNAKKPEGQIKQKAKKLQQRGNPDLSGKAPAEGQIIEQGGVKYRLIPGKPYYYAKQSMDVFQNGLRQDEKVCSMTLELLECYQDKPFFFFVHLAEVDHSGHKFGENSKEYNDALKSADTCTGKIIEKLKALNLYDKSLIYVTADHGFDEGMKSHRDAPYVFLATNDKKVIRRGERADIAPTILDRFGLDLSQIKPPLSGHPLTKSYQPSLW